MRDTAAPARAINDPRWLRAIFRASEGDTHGALALIRPLHQRALDLGDESSLPNLLEHVALLEFRAGNWDICDQLIDTASETAIRADQEIQRLALCAWRAFFDVHMGRTESARATAEATVSEARKRRLPVYEDVAQWALLQLSLSNGD